MKVMMISSVHGCEDIRIFKKEATSLTREHEVYLYAIGDIEPMVKNDVKITGLKRYPRYSRFLNWFTLLQHIFRVSPDVVHFHDPELIIVGLFLKMFTKIKVIYDVHEDVPKAVLSKYWIPKYLRRIISVVFDLIEKQSSRFFDGIITVTEHIASGFKNKHLTVIKNYSNLEIWEDYQMEIKENSAIFLGGMTSIRGINEIGSAAELVVREIPDFKLYLVGSFGEKALEEKILNQIADQAYIEFLGWLSHTEALPYMRKSKVGLLCYLPEPNHINAIPNKIFEYMSQGLVVLASHFDTWKGILLGENNCGEICNPEDPEDIAKKLIKLLKDDELIESKGKISIKEVKNKYSWDKEAERLLKFYREI